MQPIQTDEDLLAQLLTTLTSLETELAQPISTSQTPTPKPEPGPATTPDPGYPLHTLPEPVRTWIAQTAHATRVPVSMIALPFLAFVGATIGRQLRLHITPGWHEYPALWVALITLTGMGKTPAIAAARKPFDLLHHEAWLDYKTQPTSHNSVPFNPLLAQGTSYSTLAKELHQTTGLILIRDELYGLIRSMERRHGEDRQHFLTLWSSQPILTHPEAELIPAPVVSIVGGIQPTLIPHIRRAAQDGFLERFLTLYVAGIQTDWTPSAPPQPAETIADLIRPLRSIETAQNHPLGIPITLTSNAHRRWQHWYNNHIELLYTTPLAIGGFYRKMPSHLLRLALILHALHTPQNPTAPLTSTTILHAIDLVEYLRHHIHRTGMLINERHPLKTPVQILTERILHTLAQTPQGWTTRTELLRATGRPPTTAINRALDTLIQTHRIETTTTPPPKGTSGRHINAYRLTQHPPLSSRTA